MNPIQNKILELAKVRQLSSLSYREIGRQIADDDERVHPQNVKYHIDRLILAKQLNEEDRPSRLKSPDQYKNLKSAKTVEIPVTGFVGDAKSQPAFDNFGEYVNISVNLLKGSKDYYNLYFLRILLKADSKMHVLDGDLKTDDYVIVDKTKQTPKDKEYVVVKQNNRNSIKHVQFNYNDSSVALLPTIKSDKETIFLAREDNISIDGTVINYLSLG